MNHFRVSGLWTYPIKSITGVSVASTYLTTTGLYRDRLMMLVDDKGQFVTQRKYPQLAKIDLISVSDSQLVLNVANQQQIHVDDSSFSSHQLPVEIWGDHCTGFLANESINQWFSEFLGFSVSLVKFDHTDKRLVDQNFAQAEDTVGFADGFPVLVISEASLDDLNSRLTTPVSMQNFRPNIVIENCPAYAEDNWKKIQIGECVFDAVKPCSRCVLTTVDPNSGIKSAEQEPLKTLSQYRKHELGVIFGMNLIPRKLGKISIGDTLSVLS